MNRNLLTMALLICGLSVNGQKKIDYVDPLIGTNGMGHTFPGACVPHGLVQLSPDTDTIPHNINGTYQPRVYEYCAGYQHRDSSDRKSTRLNSSHWNKSRMPSSA